MSIEDPVHYSHLRRMALSPAHFQAYATQPREATRAMRVGTCLHQQVLGSRADRPLKVFPGDARRGKDWDKFLDAHQGGFEIVTQPEWNDALGMTAAVQRSDVAMGLLKGARFEVPLAWEDAGIKRATHGIDAIGDGFLVELKSTTCTEPSAFSRHATKLLYHCQMADYEAAAKANGFDTSKGLFIIGVESEPPYAVTVLKLTTATIAQGHKSVALWTEKLRSCRENGHWPAYSQTIVEYELPPWMGDEALLEEAT